MGRTMKKTLIITLAIVVVLVGAGVLVYNVFFKPKSIPGKDVTMTAVRWHAVGYDSNGNYINPNLIEATSLNEAFDQTTPEMILFERGVLWHQSQLAQKNKNLVYENKNGKTVEFNDFMELVCAINKKNPVHLFTTDIKRSESINAGDVIIVWEEIDKGKFNSKPVQEIIKTENNPKDNDLFPEMYFYIEQPNGNIARFKIFIGLSKGEGTAAFRFLSKSVFPSVESMKVTVR